jgi:hypothetical protein
MRNDVSRVRVFASARAELSRWHRRQDLRNIPLQSLPALLAGSRTQAICRVFERRSKLAVIVKCKLGFNLVAAPHVRARTESTSAEPGLGRGHTG